MDGGTGASPMANRCHQLPHTPRPYHFASGMPRCVVHVCMARCFLLSTTFCQITYANLSTFTSASLPRHQRPCPHFNTPSLHSPFFYFYNKDSVKSSFSDAAQVIFPKKNYAQSLTWSGWDPEIQRCLAAAHITHSHTQSQSGRRKGVWHGWSCGCWHSTFCRAVY